MAVAEAPPSVAAAAAEAQALGGSSGSNPLAPGKNLSSAFDALEKKGTTSNPAETAPAPKHPNQKKTEQPKPNAKAPDKPAAKAPDKAEEAKPEEAKAEETAEAEEAPPADVRKQPPAENKAKKPADFLREQLATVTKERDTLKVEVAKARPDVKEAPEYKSISEKYEKLAKDHAKLQEDLRFTNYERSDEFKTNFETPFNEAYAEGRALAGQLTVTDPTTGEQRQGKPEDFDTIMSLPEGQARDLIDSMFGTGSKNHDMSAVRRDVIKHFNARKKALEEAGKNLGEREKQTKEFWETLNGEVGKLWDKHTKPDTIPEKHRKYITPTEGDAKEKQLLEHGYTQVDRTAKENARDPNLTPEQREAIVGRAAAMRNRAAAYPMLVHRLDSVTAERDSLREELNSYKETEPAGGDGAGSTTDAPEAQPDTMDGVLAGLDKRAKPMYY